jgi:hypothetical protein
LGIAVRIVNIPAQAFKERVDKVAAHQRFVVLRFLIRGFLLVEALYQAGSVVKQFL